MPIVLAIDPGPTQSAWVMWDGDTIQDFAMAPNNEIADLCWSNHADVLAIEQIASYGMAVGAEVFETCVWTGRFMESWKNGPEEVIRIPRTQIKMHHCHSTRANDSNIRQALIDRLGAPGTKNNPGKTHGVSKDVWAALALAVCVADKRAAL